MTVPGAGLLSATIPLPRTKVVPRLMPGSVRTNAAGRVRLPIRVTPAARARLLATGSVKTRVTVIFETASGLHSSQTVKVTLKMNRPEAVRPG